ncbi:MAG: fuculose phosphate aldolase [Mycobacterium sp.]|nr:fuculose phosphate aldolase [Mycobacterium sp.]
MAFLDTLHGVTSPDTRAIRRAVADAGRTMITDGLVQGTAGNVSIRAGDVVAISPSSIPYEQVTEDNVCVLDLDGNLLDSNGIRPSSETSMHLSIYRETDAQAIVHHHGLSSVTVSTVLDELPPLHYYAARLGGPTRVARYERFGTPALARSVSAALADRTAALMQNHGAVAYGQTLDQAYDRAQLLEWLCALHIGAASLGRPRVLSSDELAQVVAARYERTA